MSNEEKIARLEHVVALLIIFACENAGCNKDFEKHELLSKLELDEEDVEGL